MQSMILYQPRTTYYISPDISIMEGSPQSQYDSIFMADRWTAITEGHPVKQHDEIVGTTGNYAENYSDPRRNTGGGVAMDQGYGPYQLAVGDSIHIVFAEAVSGIDWEKGREVGANWLQYKKGTGSPTLTLPNYSTTKDYNAYKKAWIFTGQDSILKTYQTAMSNYQSGYTLPQAPPPPTQFTVTSGNGSIRLSWANNVENDPHFGGYVIYRADSIVLNYRTVYKKIFECGKSNVNSYNDVIDTNGGHYYYYIQSKDDGTQGSTTLYSSLFWTVTNVGATSNGTNVNKDNNDRPTKFSLGQNYPNPFNPKTTISFSVPKRSFVSLKIYDLLGREVVTLVSEEFAAGNYSKQWNAANISSGIYFYCLQAGTFTETKKLVLLK